ncbi:MAG: PQQ-dependent sugar dehydrogenase [Nitrospiraceae bacterium]
MIKFLLILVGGYALTAPLGVMAVEDLPSIALEPLITKGLSDPVYLTEPPDKSGRLFVIEQRGRIRIVRNGKLVERPFLDIAERVYYSGGGEQGLLGMAFHPKYGQNGRYIVNYTREPDYATVIAEYHVSEDANVSKTTEKILLVIPQPYTNHNGGMVEFGPDGFLYIGMGDGGSGGDPENRGQNRHELLGKMLRIDVDRGAPYASPPDNPFAAGGGRPEIFAYGLRNPWRFSFDRETHELWAGDVGQKGWEEVDIIRRGGNYGWRMMEGNHCFLPKTGCTMEGLLPPIAEYKNGGDRCSVTGGYVYRGSRLQNLRGTYVYGDFCSGEILGFIKGSENSVGNPWVLLSTGLQIASFGQDQSGELYVIDYGGTVHRIIAAR